MKDPHLLLDRLIRSVDSLQVNVTSLEEENKAFKKALEEIYKHQLVTVKKCKEYEEKLKTIEANGYK